MGRPLRNRDPFIYRVITIRTDGAHLWMVPSKRTNNILGGVLARYAEIFGIEILAYCFLSNHYHLLIRAPLQNADEFQENVNREIARRMNWKLRRRGNFWERRYDDQEVISEEDLLEAFLYISTNAVRHGLEAEPSLWPGLNSYEQSLTEKPEHYPFHHHSAAEGQEKITYHSLKLTILPQFVALAKEERTSLIQNALEDRTKMLVESRKASGLSFLGARAVKEQNPLSTPRTISRSPRPPCYTKDKNLRRQFRLQDRLRHTLYSEASMRFRLGDLHVVFPAFTFKPPLHRKPRLIPFHPLPDDHFRNAN